LNAPFVLDNLGAGDRGRSHAFKNHRMLNDLKFAFRQLVKSPGFTLTAVLTLALGIGANTAIFSLVDSIMLRPLPFPQQDRLAKISYGTGEIGFFPKGWIRALGEHSASFAAISGFGADAESNVAEADSSDRVFGAEVMANAFETLGIHPAVGSFFTRQDEMAGHDSVVVLSYGYWQQRFAQDPNVIGQTLRIDGVSRRIIGVMPASVRFPYSDTQFVTPVAFKGGDPIDPWRTFDLRTFGRLKEGRSGGRTAPGSKGSRSPGAGYPRSQLKRGGGGIGVGSEVAGDSPAHFWRSGVVDRRSRGVQPDRLRRELADTGDRHPPGAGRNAMADCGRDCEAELAARRGRFGRWIVCGCPVDAVFA
jgi:hypothetical protein